MMAQRRAGLIQRLLTGQASRPEVRFVCFAVLSFAFVLLMMSFATFDGNSTTFGQPLGADFAGFYSAGKLLNEHPGEQLYDFPLQDQIYHEVLPGLPEFEKLPYVHPPFFTLIFRPLAYLPYSWAYFIWLLISVSLTGVALYLMRGVVTAIPKMDWLTAMLLIVSFEP